MKRANNRENQWNEKCFFEKINIFDKPLFRVIKKNNTNYQNQ